MDHTTGHVATQDHCMMYRVDCELSGDAGIDGIPHDTAHENVFGCAQIQCAFRCVILRDIRQPQRMKSVCSEITYDEIVDCRTRADAVAALK